MISSRIGGRAVPPAAAIPAPSLAGVVRRPAASYVVTALEAPETGHRALLTVGASSGLILLPPRSSKSDEHEIEERANDEAREGQGPSELQWVHASRTASSVLSG